MKKVAIRHDIEHEKYDAQLPKVVALGREMFRLEQLEKIACAKFEALKLAREKSKVGKPLDDVEVYLAYPVKLREDLQLFNMVVPEMYGFDYSSLENSDLITARDEVMRREDQDFPAWLSQWSPWQSVMQRLASAELKQEVEAQLNAENLENNEASRPLDRQVSAFDMQLTRKVLAAHHVLSSLDKKWKNV
jgi:hypothetical protein